MSLWASIRLLAELVDRTGQNSFGHRQDWLGFLQHLERLVNHSSIMGGISQKTSPEEGMD